MEQSKFILEVQSRQCIWNPMVTSNLDRILKRQAWEEVAAQMYDDFYNFSENEKRETVLELQRKWKSLTDYYKRRNPKEDVDERTKRTKPIVELLQFLDKIPTLSNNNHSNNKINKEVQNKDKSVDESQFAEDDILKHESNINFLQTLLVELQCLNDRQRFEFKLGVMKLIKKIKYDEDVENTLNASDHIDAIQGDTACNSLIRSFENLPRSTSPLALDLSQCSKQIPVTTSYSRLDYISAEQTELDAKDFTQTEVGSFEID